MRLNRFPRPAAGLTLLLLAWATHTAAAQQKGMSAGLARVLAEAADGYRTGQPIWIVASETYPYEVRGVETDSASALALARGAGPGFAAYGPYLTPPDESRAARATITEIRVIVREPTGRVDTTFVDPRRRDALVWSVTALDKFVIPYYTRVYGVERARELRELFLRSPVLILDHMLWSIFDPPIRPRER